MMDRPAGVMNAASTCREAGEDQDPPLGRQTAESGEGDEHDEPEHEHPAPAQQVCGPAAEQHEAEHIGAHHPLQLAGGQTQFGTLTRRQAPAGIVEDGTSKSPTHCWGTGGYSDADQWDTREDCEVRQILDRIGEKWSLLVIALRRLQQPDSSRLSLITVNPHSAACSVPPPQLRSLPGCSGRRRRVGPRRPAE